MEKIKHNHCLTDILKVCLFSLLMIAPLLASVSQMLYVTLNKNAKDSYYGENINEQQYVNTNNIKSGNYYQYQYVYPNIVENIPQLQIDNLEGWSNDTTANQRFIDYQEQIKAFSIYNNKISFFDNQNVEITSIYIGQGWASDRNIIMKFNAISTIEGNYNYFQVLEINKYSYLDNAFYYGVDQMTKSELFNWTQNTGIYTGVHAMTNGIGIESKFIPMLLTYWLVLTIVYIIIDVVIETFKYLTHMLQNKMKSKTS